MKILGIAGTLPSRRMGNDEVLDLVRHHSQAGFEGDLPRALRTIDRLFDGSGIESRHWLAPGEHPMDLMEATFERALTQAGIQRKDLDLLVYSSVSRGFTEPANSTFVTQALGLRCMNYDIVNACMGWVSSMELINDKMKAGSIRHAVIVNMEFGSAPGNPGNPKNYALQSACELAYKFPSYTIGDAVTVTIVGNASPENFKFDFVHRPDLADLCTISLPPWRSFCNASDVERIQPTGGNFQFSSYGSHLHETAGILVDLLNRQKIHKTDLHHAFTHTSSPKKWAEIAEATGITQKIHGIGHKTGNLVTASLPMAIADALENGVLKRNQFCLGWMGSAGMTFSTMTFNF